MGLERLVDPVICNGSDVFSGVLAFKKKDLRNGTRCIDPIELEKLLEGRLGLGWGDLRETPRRGDANHQSDCSAPWLCWRRGDNARGCGADFSEGMGQERDD